MKKEGYSKQAYSKARMKISSSCYKELNDEYLSLYYEEDYKTTKGYRLLGVDGSKIEIPYGEELKETYGKAFCQNESLNASRSIVIYDLDNEIVIEAELWKYNVSERKGAIRQLRKIKEEGKQRKDIIVADRGFPSLGLFVELLSMEYDFVIRYSGSEFLEEAKILPKLQEEEIEIEIDLLKTETRRRNKIIRSKIKEGFPERIKLRILRIELENGTKEYLITSLLNKKEFTKEDFSEIYNKRWNEEVYFNFQKHVLEIENFSGKTKETVLQDYYSRILVGNLHSLLISEAQEEIEKETKRNKKLKYEKYKINKSVTYGLFRDRLYDLLTRKRYQKQYRALLNEAKRHKVPIIDNRNFPREKKGNLKFNFSTKSVF